MKKQIIIIVVGCLFFGGIAGWLIRGGEEHPEGEHTHVAEDGTIYTCSMHPQIRQNEPGQCPLCGMALTPVSSSGNGDSSPFVLEMTPEAVALSNVMTTRVKPGNASSNVQLTGKVKPNEQKVSSVTANFGGRIDNLHVSFTGQEVRKGQKLATIYSPDLVNAQKELLETVKMKDRQPALYEAAREKLRHWRLSDSQIQAIETTGSIQTQFDILSHATGVVTTRNISVGDFVQRGSVLFDVVDLGQVWILLDAYESDLAAIKRGDAIQFQVAAYPGKDFQAKVGFIDPMLNPETRTVAIRAEASNPGLLLKPEMFVSAEIKGTTQSAESGLMIPKTAILWTGPRSVVYVQVGDRESPAFEMREISIGGRLGDQYLILSGLSEGDQVVSNGVFAIDAAAQLSGNYSMMLRPKTKTMQVPDAFSVQLTNLIHAYLSIKDAFVDTDVQAVRSAVPSSKKALEEIDMSLLDKDAHDIWMHLLSPIRSSLDQIQSQSDIEEQRKHFETLSDNLIDAVEYFGVTGDTLHRQYCPMAFKDKGAYWLSAEKEIRNPYFGDMMLTCGEVRQSYAPGEHVFEDKQPSDHSAGHHH